MINNNLKTLIILFGGGIGVGGDSKSVTGGSGNIGECRGNEETWKTIYENLMIPYDADLSLCVGKKSNEPIKENFLTEKSKYVWTIKEYEDWYDYFRENFGNSGFWESNLAYGLEGGGGTYGVIPLIFKHFIYQNYSDILEEYDRIILTRTDMYYIHKYPILSNDHFWLMNGEDHGGYCDRFFCFPSKYLKQCLNICEYINSEELNILLNKMYSEKNNLSFIQNDIPIKKGMFNSESYHRLYFEYTGIIYKIRRCPVLQFLVSSSEDTSSSQNWKKKSTNFKNGLIIRYKSEFINAFRTTKLFKVPTYIE